MGVALKMKRLVAAKEVQGIAVFAIYFTVKGIVHYDRVLQL